MSDKSFSFRAGIANYDEESHICTPLPVQGIVKVEQNEEEEMGFWDFEWSPLEKITNGSQPDPISLILIPGETVWVPIKSAKGGRVFALIFSSNQKYFFWLQEKNKNGSTLEELTVKDKEIFDKMTKILNEPVDDVSDDEEEAGEKDNDILMGDAKA